MEGARVQAYQPSRLTESRSTHYDMPKAEMRLFDPGPRTSTDASKYSEDHFTFLNRAASPYWKDVRRVLESWFSKYPDEAKAKLRGRFRSGASGFRGAYWELVLHEVFVNLGCTLEVDPEIGDRKTPDFRVHGHGQSFLLEATVLMEPATEQKSDARRATLLDSLERLETIDFWVDIELEAEGEQQPSGRKLGALIQEWVDQLDVETVAAGPLVLGNMGVTKVFQDRGWSLVVTALVRGETSRHPTRGFHLGPARGRQVDDHLAITEDLKHKVRKYRPLAEPLVLALLNTRWTRGSGELALALYGAAWEHPHMLREGRIDAQWINVPEGLWITRAGPQYTDAVAVLTCTHDVPWAVAKASFTMWHNPSVWDELRALPFDHVVVDSQGHLDWITSDVPLRDILGLPENWPPGKPFPDTTQSG